MSNDLTTFYQKAALSSMPKAKPDPKDEIDQSLVETVKLTDEERQKLVEDAKREKQS